jgi:hypothetical protein
MDLHPFIYLFIYFFGLKHMHTELHYYLNLLCCILKAQLCKKQLVMGTIDRLHIFLHLQMFNSFPFYLYHQYLHLHSVGIISRAHFQNVNEPFQKMSWESCLGSHIELLWSNKKNKSKSVYPSVLFAFYSFNKRETNEKKKKQWTYHTNDTRYCWVGANRQCLYP